MIYLSIYHNIRLETPMINTTRYYPFFTVGIEKSLVLKKIVKSVLI